MTILPKNLNHDHMRILSKKVDEAVLHGFSFNKTIRLNLLAYGTDERFKEMIRILDDQVTEGFNHTRMVSIEEYEDQ